MRHYPDWADIVERLELITTSGTSRDEPLSTRPTSAADRTLECVGPVHWSLQINDIDGGPGDEAGDRGGRVHVLIDPGWGTMPRRS